MELEVEVLTQNTCLRVRRCGFPRKFGFVLTRRREMDVGNQIIDVY